MSADTYSIKNPALCSIMIWSFLKGFQSVNNFGCEFPIAFIPLPLVLTGSIRSTLTRGINSKTGLLEWISRNPNILIDLPTRVEKCHKITRNAILFGAANRIVDLDQKSGFLSPLDSGLVKKKLLFEPGDERREMLSSAKVLGVWCGQIGSTKKIYHSLGMNL